jgi:hypothetical protein
VKKVKHQKALSSFLRLNCCSTAPIGVAKAKEEEPEGFPGSSIPVKECLG